MLIRDANPADIPGITRIYNDAVVNTMALWVENEVDEANRAAWLEQRKSAGYPVLVAIDEEGAVAGYASFGDFRPFPGYRHTVEHSVYIRSDQRGRGVGTALMRALIARARACGKHVMVGAVDAANETSIRMHEKLGFRQAGLMPEVGVKFGRWLDLALLQLTLSEDPPPS